MASNLHVIIGMGVTAESCARYLAQRNIPFAVNDTRVSPSKLAEFQQAYPNVEISLGGLDENLLAKADVLVVSPGVSVHEPAIAKQASRGAAIIGDIELFAREAKAPVLAITGTNAKSTVTTLVANMAQRAGKRVYVGGNLGEPALNLLHADAELYILELSSFQLETTYSLHVAVAALLNITPDHMDRYVTIKDYQAAKQRIFLHADAAVTNRDDDLTKCQNKTIKHNVSFTLQSPGENEFGLLAKDGELFLSFGSQALLAVHELPVLGGHYQANALAALAIGYCYGLPMEHMLKTLKEFKGLEHRCQLVRDLQGVTWYNDSKGTNVGAALAAINGLGSVIKGKLVLIAGGVGKNADFTPLVPAVQQYVKAVVLIGEAASQLACLFQDSVETTIATDMAEAVSIAMQQAQMGDSVLLSPACASFDMFKNFEHRGDVFTQIVKGL